MERLFKTSDQSLINIWYITQRQKELRAETLAESHLFPDSLPNLLLVAIIAGAVNVPVAVLYGPLHEVGGHGLVQLPGSVPH